MRRTSVLGVLVLTACGLLPGAPERLGRVALSDPRLAPFASMRGLDRAAYGLTPLPDTADVAVERRTGRDAERQGYDAMLHVYGCSSRTIAFRRAGAGYRWIGEQEVRYGPREVETVDGREREQVSVTYNAEAMFGGPGGLTVTYIGPEPGIRPVSNSLDAVRPLLAKWGCRAPEV